MVRRLVVIYTRFSSSLQSPKSCVDQEREVRAGLDKLGIDHSNAVVIRDEAESGTKTYRDGFMQIGEMSRSRQISILAVDDQSRLTRGANALSFLQDIVYFGGRFISLGESIDTDQENWQVMVQVMGIHNSTTISELGRRVKRGQTGRLPTQKAIDAVLGAVVTMLQSQKDWRQQIVDSIGHRVEELSKTVPQELEILRKQELELNSQIDNLVQFIASGSIKSGSVAARLGELEAQRSEVLARMSSQELLVDGRITVPSESFIDEELTYMVTILNSDSPQAANLLRRIVPKVTATHVLAVGKKRGYTQIRFRLDGWGAMRVAAESDPKLLKFVDSLCPFSDLEPTHPDEIVVDLGQPTEVDKQSPTIYAMRNRGATWKEIEAATGISLNNACTYYKRYKEALERSAKQSSSDSDLDANVEAPITVNRPPSSENNSAA